MFSRVETKTSLEYQDRTELNNTGGEITYCGLKKSKTRELK